MVTEIPVVVIFVGRSCLEGDRKELSGNVLCLWSEWSLHEMGMYFRVMRFDVMRTMPEWIAINIDLKKNWIRKYSSRSLIQSPYIVATDWPLLVSSLPSSVIFAVSAVCFRPGKQAAPSHADTPLLPPSARCVCHQFVVFNITVACVVALGFVIN